VRARHIPIGLVLAWSALACDNGGADFTVKYASDFVPAPHTVSVLGVYQDGRMSLGTWVDLSPYLTHALGSASCAAGYDLLVSSNQDLANAIDEFARDEGPTANLLTQIAPAAPGDLVLVVTLAGKVPQRRASAGAPEGAPVATGMGSPRHRGRGGGGAPEAAAKDTNQLDISAYVFSVEQKRSVALVGMQYRGVSLEDAMTRFGAKLAEAMPSLKCVGWRWDVKIDPQQLHAHLAQ
jgi:hypothetical protein